MPERQTDQEGVRRLAPHPKFFALQERWQRAGCESLTEDETRSLIADTRTTIAHLQFTQNDYGPQLEGWFYSEMAPRLKELGEEEASRMAHDMSNLCFSRCLKHQYYNGVKWDTKYYRRLLRFTNVWTDLVAKMKGSPPQFESALYLLGGLIRENESYPGLIQTPSSLWGKQMECELALNRPLEASHSDLVRILCELRERQKAEPPTL